MIVSKIADGFRKRGIISDKGDIRLAEADEVQPEFLCNDNSFRIFNFEIYIHNLDLDTDEVIVVEGNTQNSRRLFLRVLQILQTGILINLK